MRAGLQIFMMTALTGLFAVMLLAVILFYSFGGNKLVNVHSGPQIHAIGGAWNLQNLQWSRLDGSWRVSTTFKPAGVKLKKASYKILLQSFCAAILTDLPGAPEKGMMPAQIYRVDLNFMNGDGERVLPRNLPVAVVAGRCTVNKFKGDFFPVYPRPLDQWYLAESGISKRIFGSGTTDSERIRSMTFLPIPGEKPIVADFPFEFACQAVASDELARAAVVVPLTGKEVPPLEDGPVKIIASTRVGIGILRFGQNESREFSIHGSACEGEEI